MAAPSVSTSRRIARLARHVAGSADDESKSAVQPCATAAGDHPLNVHAMQRWLVRHDFEYREKLYAVLREPLFEFDYSKTMWEQQAVTWERLKVLKNVMVGVEPWKGFAASECLYFFDHSLIVRFGAHFALFGGSIKNLGTEFHHKKYYGPAMNMEIAGCFALTELGHGSNVRGVETTAQFDATTGEFIINTPTETAQKYLIGNGTTADHATVFAQLIVGGDNKGVHAFIVPLRDGPGGKILPGVRVASCGHKMGLLGVNNGRLWFSNVRVPRSALLNKYANVTADGEYVSMIPNADMRFAVSMGELVAGRVNMSAGANNIAKLALATAVRYAHVRRQFGDPGKPERCLIEYPIHRARLIPLIAAAYAFNAAAAVIKPMWINRSDDFVKRAKQMKEIHIVSSGLKSLSGWHMAATLQNCREACGGLGFCSVNRIGTMKNDSEAWMTFEGDNYVLLQQAARQLLKEFTAYKTSGRISKRLMYLPPLDDHVSRASTSAATPTSTPASTSTTTNSAESKAAPAKRTGGGCPFGYGRSSAADAVSGTRSPSDDEPVLVIDSMGHASIAPRTPAEVLSSRVQLLAYQLRERHALLSLYHAYTARVKAGESARAAWLAVGNLAVEVGRANAERWVFEAFLRDNMSCPDPTLRPHLDNLRTLYSLWAMSTSPSFLSSRVMTAKGTQFAKENADALITELAPLSKKLVDSFAVPDFLLGPIAHDYTKFYSYENTLKQSKYVGTVVE